MLLQSRPRQDTELSSTDEAVEQADPAQNGPNRTVLSKVAAGIDSEQPMPALFINHDSVTQTWLARSWTGWPSYHARCVRYVDGTDLADCKQVPETAPALNWTDHNVTNEVTPPPIAENAAELEPDNTTQALKLVTVFTGDDDDGEDAAAIAVITGNGSTVCFSSSYLLVVSSFFSFPDIFFQINREGLSY